MVDLLKGLKCDYTANDSTSENNHSDIGRVFCFVFKPYSWAFLFVLFCYFFFFFRWILFGFDKVKMH